MTPDANGSTRVPCLHRFGASMFVVNRQPTPSTFSGVHGKTRVARPPCGRVAQRQDAAPSANYHQKQSPVQDRLTRRPGCEQKSYATLAGAQTSIPPFRFSTRWAVRQECFPRAPRADVGALARGSLTASATIHPAMAHCAGAGRPGRCRTSRCPRSPRTEPAPAHSD